MRVVLLVTDLQRGGTPLRLARLAVGLRDAGIAVHVGCLAPPGPVGDALEATGIPTFACGARSARDCAALVRLAHHLRRIRPDLIHATLTHANVAARIAGGWLRIPVVTSTATIEVERRWHLVLERLTARWDRGHIVNGRTLARHVAEVFRVPPARIHVIPPCPPPVAGDMRRDEARAQLGIPPHEFVVLWVGRLDRVKRVELVIRCAEILSSVPNRFLLAGDGPDRMAVERALRLSSAAGTVHLLGWQTELAPLWAAADVLLFPSLTEGTPNAVLEAMAAGVPVVASDIPALRELSGDGKRLLLVAADAPKAYADALLWLRANEAQRRDLIQRAAEWAGAQRPEAAVHALLKVYEQVLGVRAE